MSLRQKNTLWARTYDPNTKESTLKAVKYIPSLFIKTKEDSPFKSVMTKENLTEITYNNIKDYKDAQNIFKSSNIQTFGNKSQEQGYIRQEWPNPTECDHPFHTWFFDIETLVDDDSVPKSVPRQDWKPCMHERAAMAKISSIQVYDTKSKEFYIFGLEKDWHNESNFTSEHGKINYYKMSSEENLLKAFIGLLIKRNPTVLSGWNSAAYDIPYITNRVIRVLDKRDDLYIYDKRTDEWRFNTECLDGSYVKQLSPVGLIQHNEVDTDFGKQDEFDWKGYFLEDYKEFYHKYTYTTLTSYGLSNVAIHELGTDKVNHDEHTDFGDFYRNSFDKFICYGIQDVIILIDLNNKLKLLDLAKFISYTCGVTLSDIHGTMKQWNSFMYNRCKNEDLLLPLESSFPSNDDFLLKHAVYEMGEEIKNRGLSV